MVKGDFVFIETEELVGQVKAIYEKRPGRPFIYILVECSNRTARLFPEYQAVRIEKKNIDIRKVIA